MIKRFVLFTMLAGLMAGCQSPQAPVAEKDKELEPPKQEQAREKVPESKAVEEAAPVAEPIAKVEESQEIKEAVKPASVEKPAERTTVMILMKTSKGDIKLELDKEKAPKTVENFMKYVDAGHYKGVIFHRVIDGFMIQGGGFDENMRQKPAPHTVENEADNGLSNDVGTIAMARTNDPHSGGAQFFINVKDNGFLNHTSKTSRGWGYCVFGKVVEGMDVANTIKGVPTGAQDVPNEPIFIEDIVVIED
ncbi:MAG: peptidylprolyl isomerase [Pontiella sp.]